MENQKFILKGSPSYYQQIGENTGPFTYLTICLLGVDREGRRVCNNNCIFCSNWERGKGNPGKQTMQARNFKNILEAFKQLGGKRIVTMGDGEPLFGKNLSYLLRIAKTAGKLGLGMTIFTNGRLLTKNLLERFDGLCNDISFVINFNSIDKATYEKATRIPGSFAEVMENSNYWTQRNKKKIRNTGYGLITNFAITMILSIANEGKIREIKGFVEKCSAAFICTSPMIAGSAEKNKLLIAPEIEDIRRFERLSRKLSSTGGPTSRTLDNNCGYIAGYDSGRKHFSDAGGITIDLYGNVRLCGYMLDGLPMNIANKASTVNGAKAAIQKIQGAEDRALAQIYKKFGFRPCLMRHEKLREIEEFIRSKAIN